jgi:hypothetical protein
VGGWRWGFIEAGETLKRTHYKSACELVGEILLAGIADDKQIAELEKHFQTHSDAVSDRAESVSYKQDQRGTAPERK